MKSFMVVLTVAAGCAFVMAASFLYAWTEAGLWTAMYGLIMSLAGVVLGAMLFAFGVYLAIKQEREEHAARDH